MRIGRRQFVALGALVLATACGVPGRSESGLSAPEAVAPGVEFFTITDSSLVASAGPVAVYLLKLDPARVQLASVLSNDKVIDAEPVDRIAARHGAVAAVNGGFFNRNNGEPVSLLKVSGRLVSDAGSPKGVVIITSPPQGRTEIAFDQLAVRLTMTFRAGDQDIVVPIDGVDTTRERGKRMLYTPAYHVDTDTAPAGTEWVLDGDPLRVTLMRSNQGHTPIPPKGFVLSFGGVNPPDPIGQLDEGVAVRFDSHWKSTFGLAAAELDRADHIVNGAGLLRRGGVSLTNWNVESLSREAFVDARHPRTIVGADADGFIWLGVVDGRRTESIGMSFADLQRLCDRLNLRDALNLDGGGSTTMVVKGRVVNRPSDAIGPRPVSDALLVTSRQ